MAVIGTYEKGWGAVRNTLKLGGKGQRGPQGVLGPGSKGGGWGKIKQQIAPKTGDVYKHLGLDKAQATEGEIQAKLGAVVGEQFGEACDIHEHNLTEGWCVNPAPHARASPR